MTRNRTQDLTHSRQHFYISSPSRFLKIAGNAWKFIYKILFGVDPKPSANHFFSPHWNNVNSNLGICLRRGGDSHLRCKIARYVVVALNNLCFFGEHFHYSLPLPSGEEGFSAVTGISLTLNKKLLTCQAADKSGKYCFSSLEVHV